MTRCYTWKKYGQGNGLFGTWRLAQISGGSFFINTGNAILISTRTINLHVRREAIPFNGTLISFHLNYSNPDALQIALNFRKDYYKKASMIELKFEGDEENTIHFGLADEAKGFGTRASGMYVRTKLQNLRSMFPGSRILVDFARIRLVSSSFADEAFGKIAVEMGEIKFRNEVIFKSISHLNESLIDRSIRQRIETGM